MKITKFDKVLWIVFVVMTILLFTMCATPKKAKPCKQCPSYAQKSVFKLKHDYLYNEQRHQVGCSTLIV